MKKEGLFFTALYALVFIPIIIMLILTGVSMAEEIPPEETLVPIVVPMPILLETTPASAETPQPISSSEETELINPEDNPDVDDLIRESRHTIPMKAGEERTIVVKVKSTSDATYQLVPGLTVSDIEDIDDITANNDDWIWCFEEYESFKASEDNAHEITFYLLPPEDVPNGTYEFNYELVTEEGITKKVIRLIVTIYTD